MALETEFLKLFKWDISDSEDLSSNFDIDRALNENWEKIDIAVKNIAEKSISSISLSINSQKQLVLKLLDEDEAVLCEEMVSLNDYVKKEAGKGLSTNDFTNDYKTKVDNLNTSNKSVLKTLGLWNNTYSNTSTYEVGDTEVYNHKLYECIVQIETPENFDENKWREISFLEV